MPPLAAAGLPRRLRREREAARRAPCGLAMPRGAPEAAKRERGLPLASQVWQGGREVGKKRESYLYVPAACQWRRGRQVCVGWSECVASVVGVQPVGQLEHSCLLCDRVGGDCWPLGPGGGMPREHYTRVVPHRGGLFAPQ